MFSIKCYISHKWNDEHGFQVTRSLRQHLLEVGLAMDENIKILPNWDKSLEKIALIVGAFHDFGKFTTHFQKYIQYGVTSPYKEHAFLSALYGAFYSHKLGLDNEYVYIVFACILHHHGDLYNIDEDIGKTQIVGTKIFSPNQNLNKKINVILKEQIKDLKENQDSVNIILLDIIDQFKEILGTRETFLTEFLEYGYWEVFNSLVKYRLMLLYKKINQSEPLKLLYIFSSLIDSDKFSAAGVIRGTLKEINPEVVDSYRKDKYDLNNRSPIDEMRNQLYISIKKSISESSLDDHIFTISAPTGSGKTIASIEASLTLSEKIRKEKGYISKIIYSMPFVTLLEQNFKVLEEILNKIPDFKENHQQYILSHHHLSDPTYIREGEELPVEKSLLLVESWESLFIVTTFVQLFESLLSNKNKKLKKVHNMANSVIIIDEIQSINVELWPTIRDILTIFSKEYNIYFIIMSATLPEIYSNAIELSGSKGQIQERFKKLDRVILHINITPCTIQAAIDSKNSYFGKKSILFIFNTIKSSLDAFIYLKNCRIESKITSATYYISGNLTPKDRSIILNEILKDLANGKKPIVIGTQIFEAGVDIDFDIVVRDVAPIDSIIQSSGRANRNGKNLKGEVFVIDISKDEKTSGYYSRQVYGKIHTDVSLEVLKEHNGDLIEEAKFIEIVKDYYKKLKDRYPEGESIYINAINNLRYGKGKKESNEIYSSCFKIIEDYPECNVFIEEDEEATLVLLRFREIEKLSDPIARRIEFIKIKKSFYKFIINMDEKKIKTYGLTLQKEDNIWIMYKAIAENQYDKKTGLINNSQRGVVI